MLLQAGYLESELSSWSKQDGMYALNVIMPSYDGHPKVDYTEYMKSPEWKARKKKALARQVDGCAICCSTKKLQVHHRTYKRLGHELETDLVVLCGRCHRTFHGILVRRPEKVRPTVLDDLPEVNELDRAFIRACERDD